MRRFNYRWHRSRLKIPVFFVLPIGEWRTVRNAALTLGVSESIIRVWYLKKEIKVCYSGAKKRVILVDISKKIKQQS